jgi:hypothetical protein
MAKVKLPTKHKQVRPDLGQPFLQMLYDLRDMVNEEPMNHWSYTVANRRTVAEAWKRAFPDRKMSQEAKNMLLPYYKDLDL